ncbi:MAG TPA: RnfABCDGE type electron transport complex subunit D [Muribaculum sp.]|uniref:Ion-translocating oxidoreductase complex subunit D n=1 Tax=Heminiphilus faecis TaxID=2601703 RepID=A0ABV4CVK0_9BACT|nr:RnfABCDGE type electron transport complex subunit D [Heminiphilus faecis]RLT77672.1 RnfABCDGE type electron transport complex subunit D [bacterium J10(2018)]HRF69006.1 RnfABCDGE type electron transport complex subunit D [Muribaculum sp.]
MAQLLTVSASPHIHTKRTVAGCMRHVTIALLPAAACALYFFGIGALIVIATSIAACAATEYIINRWMLRRPSTLADGSAILTGLLLAFNLPSNLPVWAVIIGSVVAIGIGKMAFGGLGCNIWNPALVGRVFLLISFPVQMTSWPLPLVNRSEYFDAVTGATTLGILKLGEADSASIDILASATGAIGGSLGEVSAIALLIGFIYLLCMKVITWHIPVSILGTVALFTLCIGGNLAVELLSGGLMLGACFMATDYVTSPMSKKGMLIFGVMIGLITVIIRRWGAYPEGVSFAILLMNGFVPLIDRYIKPRKFGERRSKS